MAIGEFEVLFPIILGDVMFTGPDMVADEIPDRLIEIRHFIDTEALFPEQPIDGFGMFGGKEFPFWVGPLIFDGAGDIDRPGSDEGDQFMLIDRQFILVAVVSQKIIAEPVWKGGIDSLDCLSVSPTA